MSTDDSRFQATKYETTTTRLRALREAYEAECKAALGDALKEFMVDHTEVMTIYWSQYTPYFNDGDPCLFTLEEVWFSPLEWSEVDSRYHHDELDPDEEGDVARLPLNSYSREDEQSEELSRDMKSLDEMMREVEGALEDTFGGDAAFVRAYLDEAGALKYEVEEFDHD